MKLRYVAVAALAAACVVGPAAAQDATSTALLKKICMAAIVDGLSYEPATERQVAANAKALGLTVGEPESDNWGTETAYTVVKPSGKYEAHVDDGLGADSCSVIPPAGATASALWASILEVTPGWQTVTKDDNRQSRTRVIKRQGIVDLEVTISHGMCGERRCLSVLAMDGSPF